MPLTRSPMRDAIAMSMMQGQFGTPGTLGSPGVPRTNPYTPFGRMLPMFNRFEQERYQPPQTVSSGRPPVFAGNSPVTPTPQPIAPAASASSMATQGVNAGYRYGRMAEQPKPAEPFAQQNTAFPDYGFGIPS